MNTKPNSYVPKRVWYINRKNDEPLRMYDGKDCERAGIVVGGLYGSYNGANNDCAKLNNLDPGMYEVKESTI